MKSKRALGEQLLALLPIFINSLINGCILSWLSNAVFFLTRPNHQPSATIIQCGWMESWFQIGRLVFALPGGILADKFGKKSVIIFVGCLHFFTWLALSVSRSIQLIYVVRFLQGIVNALLNSTCFNVIGETASPEHRGTFVGFHRIALAAGLLIEGLLSVMFTSYFILSYATTAVAFLFFPTIYWISETPNHLVAVGRYEAAKRVLWKLRRGLPENEIHEEYESLRESVEAEAADRAAIGWFQFLRSRAVRRLINCAVLLNLVVFANGGVVIQLYAAVIFPSNYFLSNNFYPLILAIIQLLSSVGSTLMLEAFPRRGLFIFAGIALFLIQFWNGIVYYQYSQALNNQEVWKWCFLLGNAGYCILYYGLIPPLNATVRTEIFPHSINGFGNAVCLICQSASAIFCYYIHNILTLHFGLWISYLVFAFNSTVLVVVVYFFLPETRGKSLAEVQKANRTQTGEKKTLDSVVQHESRY